MADAICRMRTSRVFWALNFLGLLLISCQSKSDSFTPIKTDSNPTVGDLSKVIERLQDHDVKGYVLIHHTALEYRSLTAATEDQSDPKSIVPIEHQHLDLHTPDSVHIQSVYNWGSPFICREVLADHGSVVEVRTTDVEDEVVEKLGHGGRGADYVYEITTFVRKADLVPVISRPFVQTFPDGSWLQLDPGVAIGIPWTGDRHKRVVSVQQLHFPWIVPDSALQLSYIPRIKTWKSSIKDRMLAPATDLKIGGKLLGKTSEIRLTELRKPIEVMDNGMIHLASSGIQMVVNADLPLVPSYLPEIARPVLTQRFENPPRWYYRVESGTQVFWEDGQPAGRVRQYFSYQTETSPSNGWWCETIAELFVNEKLCFRIEDVEVIENP